MIECSKATWDDGLNDRAADVSELACPDCGAHFGEILVWPELGSWFHRGEAQCGHCGLKFPIALVNPQ